MSSPDYSRLSVLTLLEGFVSLFIFASKFSGNVRGPFVYGPIVRLLVLMAFGFICSIYFVRVVARRIEFEENGRLLAYVTAPILLAAADTALPLFGVWSTLRDRFFLFFLIVSSVVCVKLVRPELARLIGREGGLISNRCVDKVPIRSKYKGLGNQRWRLAALMVLLGISLLNFSTIYYNYSQNIVSDQSVEATGFVGSKVEMNGRLLGGRYVKNLFGVPGSLTVSGLNGVFPQDSFSSPPYLLVLDQHIKILYQIRSEETYYDFYATLSGSLNRIYDDSNYRVYAFYP